MITRVEQFEVQNRLTELGIEEEQLRNAVERGFIAFISCTANHPRLVRGIWAWGETVRALRDYLLPAGWSRSDENNYSIVIHPDGELAIAVATGGVGTGRADSVPTTKAPKGPNTLAAVTLNQFSLFPEEPSEHAQQREARVTWILLIHRSDKGVWSELSLPSSMDRDGYIDHWQERILLGSIPIGGDSVEALPPPVPEITIDIERRA
jgi:hypothetical protein